jgi:hypothetical protein
VAQPVGSRHLKEGGSQPLGFDWQDHSPYGALGRIDRAGLMWEWLRRDPGYVEWYVSASQATRGSDSSHIWGLHFR